MQPIVNRATLIGLLIGTGLATIATLGPLVSAITSTVGAEMEIGTNLQVHWASCPVERDCMFAAGCIAVLFEQYHYLDD